MHQTTAIDKVFQRSRIALSLANAQDEDLPLIRVTDAFCDITGYDRAECLGRNCRFLQADDLDQPARKEIRTALAAQKDIQVVLRNYTRFGDSFENLLFIHHIRDMHGKVVFLLGSQFVIHGHMNAEALNRHLEALDEGRTILSESRQLLTMSIKRQLSESVSITLHSAVLTDLLSAWTKR